MGEIFKASCNGDINGTLQAPDPEDGDESDTIFENAFAMTASICTSNLNERASVQFVQRVIAGDMRSDVAREPTKASPSKVAEIDSALRTNRCGQMPQASFIM